MHPRIVLATLGSLGDLHPFMALGLALRARGAHVVIGTAAEYQAKVARAGLECRPVRPSFDDMQRSLGMDRPELTRRVLAEHDFLLRQLIMPHLRETYDDMHALVQGADLVLTSSLAFAARLAAERSAVPWIAVVLQPLMFLSAYDPPAIPNAEWLGTMLRLVGTRGTRAIMRMFKRVIERQLRPVAELRAAIGLPRGPNALFEGQFSRGGALGLYSQLLGGVQPDYPAPTSLTGFATFDSFDGGPSELQPSLSDFLAAGEPPLVFTLGSLIVNSPGTFFQDSLAAARLLGRRAVLLIGDLAAFREGLVPAPDVHVSGYAPHSLLFPRAAAIIHQGGIGTLAQALLSGRPQLIVPYYADQTDNAARAVRLGVARSLPPAHYAPRTAARELSRLCCASIAALRAEEVRLGLAGEGGAAHAASVVMNRLESGLV